MCLFFAHGRWSWWCLETRILLLWNREIAKCVYLKTVWSKKCSRGGIKIEQCCSRCAFFRSKEGKICRWRILTWTNLCYWVLRSKNVVGEMFASPHPHPPLLDYNDTLFQKPRLIWHRVKRKGGSGAEGIGVQNLHELETPSWVFISHLTLRALWHRVHFGLNFSITESALRSSKQTHWRQLDILWLAQEGGGSRGFHQSLIEDFWIRERSIQQNRVPGDPSCPKIDPRWSLDNLWVFLDHPKMMLETKQIRKTKRGNLTTSKTTDAASKQQSILVWFESSQVPWRLIWWQIGCQILLLESNNESKYLSSASLMLMLNHECSWCIMSTRMSARPPPSPPTCSHPTPSSFELWKFHEVPHI